jgi:hypothetical protein
MLISMICSLMIAAPTVEKFEGVARDERGAVRYRETHEVERDGGRTLRAVTRYFDPRGRMIGELRSKYDEVDPYAPSYTFTDAKGRTVEAARLKAGSVELSYGGRSERIALDREGGRLVLGQGLNLLARDRLDALARGEKMTVRFAIPSRFEVYGFQIEAIESADRDVVTLRVEIDNWLLAIVAPSLEVDYDRKTGRLLAYRGVSNLEDERGETQTVTIGYHYPADPTAAIEAKR